MPMNHFMVLFSEAMLDWVGSYISHILILKTSQNVHDGGFFFFSFCSSTNLLHWEETSSWVTLMGPRESNGQLLTHLIPCKSEPGHLA